MECQPGSADGVLDFVHLNGSEYSPISTNRKEKASQRERQQSRRPGDRFEVARTGKRSKRPQNLRKSLGPAMLRVSRPQVGAAARHHMVPILTWPQAVRGGRLSASQPGGTSLSRDNVFRLRRRCMLRWTVSCWPWLYRYLHGLITRFCRGMDGMSLCMKSPVSYLFFVSVFPECNHSRIGCKYAPRKSATAASPLSRPCT